MKDFFMFQGKKKKNKDDFVDARVDERCLWLTLKY